MSLTLLNRNPLIEDFTRTREEMDRMLGRFLGGGMMPFEGRVGRNEGAMPSVWLPPVDVSEGDDEVLVSAEIPGIAARDVEITVTGNTLSISGKKDVKEESEQENFYRCERRFGAFRRTIELPESVDPERIAADAENGVITIRIAKKPGQRTRKVEIKTAAPTTRRVTVPG
jgi:HSP20 family protein